MSRFIQDHRATIAGAFGIILGAVTIGTHAHWWLCMIYGLSFGWYLRRLDRYQQRPCHGRAGLALRQARRGNFHAARIFACHAVYGLTHWRCRQCSWWKGATTYRCCDTCRELNFIMAVFAKKDAEA